MLIADRIEPDRIEPDRIEPDRIEPDRIEPDRIEPDRIEPDRIEHRWRLTLIAFRVDRSFEVSRGLRVHPAP